MRKNEIIYKMKGIAIISVIFAHCGNRITHSIVDMNLDYIRGSIGTIGVPIFLIISGYLYNNNKPFWEFWKSKFESTIIPWLFWGTFVWSYEVVRKGLDYAKLSEWLLGIGTYLWYMRTIVLLWLVLYFVKKYQTKLILFFCVCAGRVIVYDFHLVPITNLIVENFVLWLPFFIFGMVLKDSEKLKKYKIKKTNSIIAIICVVSIVLYHRGNITYFSEMFLLYAFGCSYIIFCMMKKFFGAGILNEELLFLGKNSFLIYMIHMPLAGAMSNLFSREIFLLYMVLLQPLGVIVIAKFGIKLLELFSEKFSWISTVTGVNGATNRGS